MGFVIEEAVYAPLYYGYGGEEELERNRWSGQRAPSGQRTEMARQFEAQMLAKAPDTVLVHFKAAPDTIRKRMSSHPDQHRSASGGAVVRQLVQPEDVELVLQRFEEEVEASLIQKRIVLDTTDKTVDETMREFVEKYEPFVSNADLLRRKTTSMGSADENKVIAKL